MILWWILLAYYAAVVVVVFGTSLPAAGRQGRAAGLWAILFIVVSVAWPVWLPFVWAWQESDK